MIRLNKHTITNPKNNTLMKKTEEQKTKKTSKKGQPEVWYLNLGRTNTTRNESKDLLLAGVPAPTADYYYDEGSELELAWEANNFTNNERYWNETFPFCKKKKRLPCWSITRLMQISAICWKEEGEFDPITMQKFLADDFCHRYVLNFLQNIESMDFERLKRKPAFDEIDLFF